jgi:hypothetical protein
MRLCSLSIQWHCSLTVPAGAAAAQQGVVFTAGRWVPSNGGSSNGYTDDGFTSGKSLPHHQQLQHRRASVAVGDSDRLLRKNVILQVLIVCVLQTLQ